MGSIYKIQLDIYPQTSRKISKLRAVLYLKQTGLIKSNISNVVDFR